MFTTQNNNIQSYAVNFTFAFDPQWEEKQLFQKFKDVMKSDIKYYRYTIYLKDLTRSRSFKTFLQKKQEMQHNIDNLPMFWFLGEQIFYLYKENQQKEKKNIAIVYRCVWSVEINKDTESEKITNISFFNYEFDQTILNVY